MDTALMGSEPKVDCHQAAEILGCDVEHVMRLWVNGSLRPCPRPEGLPLFYKHEVEAAASAASAETSTAQQAWATARIALERVHRLEHLIGLSQPPSVLHTNEALIDLLAKVELGRDNPPIQDEGYEEWASLFFSVCDQTFTRFDELGRPAAWRIFLDAITAICRTAATGSRLNETLRRLFAARDHLKQEIFWYFVAKYGVQQATKTMYPEHFKSSFDRVVDAAASPGT